MLGQHENSCEARSGQLRVPLDQERTGTAFTAEFLGKRPPRRARVLDQAPKVARPFTVRIGLGVFRGQLVGQARPAARRSASGSVHASFSSRPRFMNLLDPEVKSTWCTRFQPQSWRAVEFQFKRDPPRRAPRNPYYEG